MASSSSASAASASPAPASSASSAAASASASARPAASSRTIAVDSYSAHITVHTWRVEWPKKIKQLGKDASKYVLITDSNLSPLYGLELLALLRAEGLDVLYRVLSPGEGAKCRRVKAAIEDWMLAEQCGRDTVCIALGGGVMGDLVGFVASTYMRGIPVIQCPTSFLAMVDSSIGGKTGIDAPAGKNLVGAFHRPLGVLIDLSVLLTLPQRELCNGMAESLKAGLVADAALFEFMESHSALLLQTRDLDALAHVVERSVSIKAVVVVGDEKEKGRRAILNFGHSVGHAVESLMAPDMLHGEAVTIGMIAEALLACSMNLLPTGVVRRMDNAFRSFSLPTALPPHLTPKALLHKMSVDKKNKAGRKEIVLLTSIGSVKSEPAFTTMIPDEALTLLLSGSIGVHAAEKPVSGSVAVPGSKSLSNRCLLLAAMGSGPCVLRGLLHSQDTQVMLDSLRLLGVQYAWNQALTELTIQGSGGVLALPPKALYLGNAGTASRFLTSMVCLLQGSVELTGNKRMHERPCGDLVDALRSAGCRIDYLGKSGCLPLKIEAKGLSGGEVKLKANISSQFVSSLLLSAPHAKSDLVLRLDQSAGKGVVSKPFIDMTVNLMKRFGAEVDEVEPLVYRVKAKGYANPAHMLVEGDASSATYPLALAAVTGGEVQVTNVGRESLQGDAAFCKVLEQMGCTVTQSATSTTVRGPDRSKGERLEAVVIDMDHLTDTFLTLASVAVFAEGVTKISGVANQRVKECDRLAAMVASLGQYGVKCVETETGMDITGVGWSAEAVKQMQAHVAASTPHSVAVIQCHDDHRVAMALSLVGAVVGATVLDEKRCVDKTYPEYWDALTALGVPVYAPAEGVVALHDAVAAPQTRTESIVLTGMRGSGKTTLGQALASFLGRRMIDLDSLLESELGGTIKALVEKEGWPAFRAKEVELLQRTLAANPSGCVLSLGGGVVETPGAVALLKKQPLVIQLRRHIEDIVAYLGADSIRPGFDAREAWAKREPLFAEASRFEFAINQGDSDWPRIERDFFRFVSGLLGPSAPVPSNSFFLSLTYPSLEGLGDLAALATHFDRITEGCDAIEVRADLINEGVFETEKVHSYIATIRRASRLPLIYTVRSKSQGGAFPDYASNADAMISALLFGLRLGVEFFDVEVALPPAALAALYTQARSQGTRIIASHHTPLHNGGTDEELRGLFDHALRAAQDHRPDVVKIVVKAAVPDDALRLIRVASEVEQEWAGMKDCPQIISLAMGSAGRLSRVYNRCLTPVTHQFLHVAAAPGQIGVQQIMRLREGLGLAPFDSMPAIGSKQWFLFGSPITHSPSPLLHNTAFEWSQVAPAFVYTKLDTASIDAVRQCMARPEFGGANVTIPLKEEAVALVATTSASVKAIGALNTIVRAKDSSWHGENTDWMGTRKIVAERMPAGAPAASDVAIVIGAGGTARAVIYALQQLGFSNKQLLIFNPRTKEKAQALANHFHISAVPTLTRASISTATELNRFSIRVLVSTIPGSVGMRLDDAALLDGQADKPVVMDASYVPADTAFLLQCQREFGVPAGSVIRGMDLLVAQGMFGMALWMGKETLPLACQERMEVMVRESYRKQQEQNASGNASSAPK